MRRHSYAEAFKKIFSALRSCFLSCSLKLSRPLLALFHLHMDIEWLLSTLFDASLLSP